MSITIQIFKYSNFEKMTDREKVVHTKLGSLFTKYGSDKQVNGYSPLYSTLFSHLQDRSLQFLEIGIGTMIPNAPSSMVGYALSHYRPGGSLRAWRDFFENGFIYGMDIQPDTQFQEDRIQTFLCDSTNKKDTDERLPKQLYFDIILDDGNHHYEAQLKTLYNFYPKLRKGGIYIIEDIYPSSELLKYPELIEKIIGHDTFFFVGLKNNQCVIYKV